MAIRMRLDTMAGAAFLRQEAPPEEDPRLALVTSGEELARLLEGAMAFDFQQEVSEPDAENSAVERFLRDCTEFSDVRGLPASLRQEMVDYFGQRLDGLWRHDWLVFGGVRESPLEPGPHPLKGRVVSLYLARYDSPSVEMAARLRQSMDTFKAVRVRGRVEDEPGGGLLH